MNRFLKTFLLWLLIAALPVQGMAAVIKASCRPDHHVTTRAALQVAGLLHATGSDSAHHHHHHNGSEAQDAATDTHVSVDTLSDHAPDHASDAKPHHKASTCSACAACCFGAAAPPPSLSFTTAFNRTEAIAASAIVPFIGFIPAGLERPPRPVSA